MATLIEARGIGHNHFRGIGTITSNEKLPAVVGFPENAPVAAFKLMPGGSAPVVHREIVGGASATQLLAPRCKTH